MLVTRFRTRRGHVALAIAVSLTVLFSPLPQSPAKPGNEPAASISESGPRLESVGGPSFLSKAWSAITGLFRGFGEAESASAQIPTPTPIPSVLPTPTLSPPPIGDPPPETRQEIVSLRIENAKFFREPDGSSTAEFYTGPIHFLTSDGAWEEIDATIVPSTRPGYAFRNRRGSFMVDFAASIGATDTVRVEGESGTIGFTPAGANPLSVPQAEGNTVTYPEIYPGVDLTYEVRNNGLKELLVLKEQPQVPVSFRFLLGLGGLTAQEQGGAVSLIDAGGETEFTIPPAWMEDSADPGGDGAVRSHDVTMALSTQGGQVDLELTPDFAWLQDPARVYPVTIDPSLIGVAPNFDVYVHSLYPGQNYPNEAVVRVGKDTDNTIRRAFLKFDNIATALRGKTLHQATLDLRTTWEAQCGTVVSVQRVDQSWGTGVTWNNQPAAGGDLSNSQACAGMWTGWDVTSTVASWIANGSNNGFRVTATESNANARKRFGAIEHWDPDVRPRLTVRYNTPASPPSNLQPPSGTSSIDPTPQLSAVHSDSDGDAGIVSFTVRRLSDGQVIDGTDGSQNRTLSGQTATFDAELKDANGNFICGETFQWTVESSDGFDSPSTSSATYSTYRPASPSPVSPAEGVTLHTLTPTFTAEPPGGPNYQFVIRSGSTDIVRSPVLSTPTWTVPEGVLADGGKYSWYVAGAPDVCGSAPRTFKLDVQRLGARSHFPMVDFSLGHGTAASVNAANGNLVVGQTDVSLPTVEDPFVISRSYNSRAAGKLIYVEDQLPYDGQLGGDPWLWDDTTIPPWSGTRSHTDPPKAGVHQHFFHSAQGRLFVPHGATLVTYARLSPNPGSVPREVMLQFRTPDGSWEHRAYWGEDLIGWGTSGTASRRSMGGLPLTGQWVRLEVPASFLGLEGQLIDGVAYTLYDGQAWFDKTYLGGGAAGYGWSLSNELVLSELSFSRLVERTDNAHLELLDSYGGVHFYYQVGQTSEYVSESGDFAKVDKNTPAGEWRLKDAEGFRYYFSMADGRLLRILSPELGDTVGPKTFEYAYSPDGRLTELSDRLGRKLLFSYHPDGMLYQIKAQFDSNRVLASYEYDGHDQLRAVIDANGHRTEYTYNDVTHDLVTITTPRGTSSPTDGDFKTTIDYEPTALAGEEYRRVKAVKRPHTEAGTTTDLITSFAYTPETRTTKVTSPKGNVTTSDPNDFVTTFEYNERLNPKKITDPVGNATVMDWNTDNLRTRLLDRENNEWLWEYDGNGNVCRETLPASILGDGGSRAKIQYFYDEFTGGNGSSYTCSPSTKPTHNLRTGTKDAMGRQTKIEYLDPHGGKPWVTAETIGYGTQDAAKTTYTYYGTGSPAWEYGRVQTKIMPKGNVGTGCDQTCINSHTITYNYWGPGAVYSLPSEGLINVDQKGWLKSTSQPGDTPVTCEGAAATACFHYDPRGNNLHTLDAKGDHYQIHDPDDRLVKSQDLGAVGAPDPAKWVIFSYDADGNRTRVVDPDITGDKTEFPHDDLNRLSSAVDAWGRTTTYKYDDNSNVKEKTTTGIGTTTYTYDGLDRLKTLTDPQGKITTYARYDKEGRLLEKQLPNATHLDYAYNGAGWLTSVNNRPGSSHSEGESSASALGDTTYTYDGSGKKMTEVLPGSAGMRTYEYDAVGRLETVIHGTTTRTYEYDENSNRKKLLVNGVPTETYTYNALDQLEQVTGPAGTQTFTYNTAGEVTSHLLPGYVTPSKTRTGSVDAAVSPGYQSWRFDVTAGGPVQATLSWSGSADLNLQLRKIVGNSAILKAQAPNGQPETLSYQVSADDTGEYSLRVIAASGQASYTLSFTYPVAKQGTYTYDAAGIPVYENNNVSNATYLVDGLDRVIRRTERTFEGAVTSDRKYAFDDSGDSRVAEIHATNGSVLTSFVTDPDGLLAIRGNGATTYQYFNGHGDLVQTANEAGTPSNPTPSVFDEFGNSAGGSYPYGWTGRQQRDTSAVTGTIRMGVRLYDPTLGRFLSRDPVDGGSLNDYEYAGGDPVNGFDLDGLYKTESGKPLSLASKLAYALPKAVKSAAKSLSATKGTNVEVSVSFGIAKVGFSTRGGRSLGWGLGVPGASVTISKGKPSKVTTSGTACYGGCVSYGTGITRKGSRGNSGWGFGVGTPQGGWYTEYHYGGK